MEFSMPKTQPAAPRPRERTPSAARSFEALRSMHDTLVLGLFSNKAVQREVQDQVKTNLDSLWGETRRILDRDVGAARVLEPLEIHRKIVEGLPGEALFVSSAMAFDSMNEALRLFDLSAKTAKQRIGDRLSSRESEIALRIGRVLTLARLVLGSADAAREYLRTPNFALDGAVPRDLLKTAEGEQVVIAELQAQAEGGPV
jgi:putative toxin-antitoxin system antitoxin component (TIGR02293 family)